MAEGTLSEREITTLVDNVVKDLESNRILVDKVILYGSYAQGCPREFSDVDLAIVSPSFARKGLLRVQEELARSMAKYLAVVEPVGCSPQEFEKADRATFWGEIRRAGKVVYSAASRKAA